jgi:hypothetical protein
MLYHGRDSCWGLELGTPALGRLVLGRLVLGIVLGETRRWETLGGHLFGNQRLLCTRLGGWRFQWCVPSIFAFTTQSFGRCLAFHCIHGRIVHSTPAFGVVSRSQAGYLPGLFPFALLRHGHSAFVHSSKFLAKTRCRNVISRAEGKHEVHPLSMATMSACSTEHWCTRPHGCVRLSGTSARMAGGEISQGPL